MAASNSDEHPPTPVPGPARPAGTRRPDETQPVPHDTERHSSTRISGRDGTHGHETTVFTFRDPRAARPRIYRSGEGLPWAITDLARKMNSLIAAERIPGKRLQPGDIVQAAVVSYFCDGKLRKPQTTPDSPSYATLPYRIVVAEEGYWTAEPALPPETLVHFSVPATVGDLIPGLSQEQRQGLIVSLQLKEATHVSTEVLAREAERALASTGSYEIAEKGEQAEAFKRLAESPAGDAGDDWRDLLATLDEVASGSDTSARLKRKMRERSDTDRIDFGFGKPG